MEKEIKRLRHHVSVLSKRNHQLVKDGKSRAASPITSDASLSEKTGEEVAEEKPRSVDEDEEVAVEEERDMGVVAESMASFEEAEVAEPMVRLPVAVRADGGKKRKVEVEVEREKEGSGERELIAPLGPRCYGGSNILRTNEYTRPVRLGVWRTRLGRQDNKE